MNADDITTLLINLKTSSRSADAQIASAIGAYLQDGDSKHLGSVPSSSNYGAYDLGKITVTQFTDNPESRRLVMFALLLADAGNRENGYCRGFGLSLADANRIEAQFTTAVADFSGYIRSSPDAAYLLAKFVLYYHWWSFDFGWIRERTADFPFGSAADPRYFDEQARFSSHKPGVIEKLVIDLPDETLESLLVVGDQHGDRAISPRFVSYLAVHRPAVFERWLQSGQLAEPGNSRIWSFLIRATDHYDSALLDIVESLPPARRFFPYLMFFAERGDEFAERCRMAAHTPENRRWSAVISFLSDRYPEDVPPILSEVLSKPDLYPNQAGFVFEKAFGAAARAWNHGGQAVFEQLTIIPYHPHDGLNSNFYSMALRALAVSDTCPPDELKNWHRRILQTIGGIQEKRVSNAIMEEYWNTTAEVAAASFVPDFLELMGDGSKILRDIAAGGVARVADENIIASLASLLASGNPDQKSAAAACLGMIHLPTAIQTLISALSSEQNGRTRAVIMESIRKLDPNLNLNSLFSGTSVADWVARFHQGRKPPKAPKAGWLEPSSFPAVYDSRGVQLPPDVVLRLIEMQSKHKLLEAAPDILPLLAHLDRARCAPFALALVEGFLNSEQAAGDRWALALGGLLGDKRLIPPLLSRIPGWCDNSRHKLAEYAAQTIALLPGDEPLMVLDTLANRYRNKFKNVGKACAEAFQAAATARGITPAELGDLVVPAFEFDEEGVRTFAWDGGSIAAELGTDFKLAWFDPAGDKTWTSLPAFVPDAVKDEVRLLGKLLREAVKGQTARLELALVFQRRWPLARWRELYEAHPVLRGFASGLVWGVYDAAGALLRNFRRYHNGILADAQGNEEELPETDAVIGMVHPLELELAARQAWQAHLARLKVKQPFPQLDRPVELLDPLLANRREIAVTRDQKTSAGTFRSRAEKRGWFRGSVVDAGGISSYVKTYPLADVEVILPLDNFYIGVDPMDTIELAAAYFVRADTVARGSYTYDEPAPDDPRVLRFAEVSAVVYSETISDLKAIVATKETP